MAEELAEATDVRPGWTRPVDQTVHLDQLRAPKATKTPKLQAYASFS
jgi:hypothetical protein